MSLGSVRFWGIVLGAYALVAALFVLARVPSPYLFAGVVAGGLCAWQLPEAPPFPGRLRTLGLAVIGVGAGQQINRDVLATLAANPVAVLGGVVATLAISMAAGQLLRLSKEVDGPTALFASIAGGASGVTVVAREFDADETTVLTIQYFRVLFVLATIPVVAPWFGADGGHASVPEVPRDLGSSLAFTALAIAGGLGLGAVLTFSASRLVMPLLVASGLSIAGVYPDAAVPEAVMGFGYATTGLMVGLSFTRTVARRLARLMPLAVLQLLIGVSGCAAVGMLVAKSAGVSLLDGYLATTPGGLPAVTAIAIGSGASVGIVVSMQLLRIFLALLLAPVLAAVLRRRGQAPA